MTNATELARRLAQAGVPHVEQSSSGYDQEISRNYNPRPDAIFRPAVFAKPENVEQVSAAVKAGAGLGFKVVARSGGHSSCGMSLGGQDGQLVIDMGHFNDITIDAARHQATFGPAVRLGRLYSTLAEEGEAISAGICPAVGAGGHFSHGGAQAAHRTHGMGVDAIYAYDAVLADGFIVHVAPDEHPDLFWALKGFASSYAIVTRFYVNTFTPPPRNQHFMWVWHVDAAEAANIWKTWQTWGRSPDAVRELSACAFGIFRNEEPLPEGQVLALMVGNFLGDNIEFEKRIKSLKSQLPPTVHEVLEADIQYIELLQKVSWPDQNAFGLETYTDRWAYYEKTLLLTADLPAAAIEEAVANMASWKWDGVPYKQRPMFMIDLMGGTDSRLNQVSPELSSIPRRKDLTWMIWMFFFHFDNDLPAEVSKKHRALVDDLYAIFARHLDQADYGSYFNAPDVSLQDGPQKWFGENAQRLSELKRRFDQHDVFSTPLTVTG